VLFAVLLSAAAGGFLLHRLTAPGSARLYPLPARSAAGPFHWSSMA